MINVSVKIAEPRIPRLREELGNLILSIGSKTARDHRLGILIKHHTLRLGSYSGPQARKLLGTTGSERKSA